MGEEAVLPEKTQPELFPVSLFGEGVYVLKYLFAALWAERGTMDVCLEVWLVLGNV